MVMDEVLSFSFFLVSVLFVKNINALIQEDVFWCLVKLCLPGNGTYADTVDLERGFGMGGLYENHLPLVSEYVYVIERLMKQFLPRLNAHIEEEGISVGLFAPQYLITIFLVNLFISNLVFCFFFCWMFKIK